MGNTPTRCQRRALHRHHAEETHDRAGVLLHRHLRRLVRPFRHPLPAGGHRRHLHDHGGQAGGRHRAAITDCEDTLSPVEWHLDGRAKGFYVGVYRPTLDADGTNVDYPDQFACAYSETAEPTAEAIGDLICEALKNAAIHPLGGISDTQVRG